MWLQTYTPFRYSILIYMLTVHRLEQSFDKNNDENMCAAVLFKNNKGEEQQDNKLISLQEVKLRCGIHNVNTLWGPESKSYKLFYINFLSGCIQAYGCLFCSKFQGSPGICLRDHPSSWNFTLKRSNVRI